MPIGEKNSFMKFYEVFWIRKFSERLKICDENITVCVEIKYFYINWNIIEYSNIHNDIKI